MRFKHESYVVTATYQPVSPDGSCTPGDGAVSAASDIHFVGAMAMGKLTGKVAVITGGTSGMGLATAERFVHEGAYVFIMGRRKAELDRAVAKIGRAVTGVQGDIASAADLDRLYATVGNEKGH